MDTNRERIKNMFTYIALAVIILIADLPFISMVGTALKKKSESFSPALLPRAPSLENFAYVLRETIYARYVLNSLVIACTVTLACIVVASVAGYALSRFRSGFFSFYSILLLILQMFPGVLLLIPLFVIYSKLGMADTHLAVMISYTTINLPFSIWMLKGYFDTIPFDLEESGLIDGCSQFRSFYFIILPISAPGISTVAIFTFINSWNEYILASIFLKSSELKTLTVGLQLFVQQFSTDWPSLMAASTIAAVPTIIFLFIAQKYIVEGLTAGAVKG